MCGIVKLHPSRGRKTSVVCPCFLISNEFPARGRKQPVNPPRSLLHDITIYPRKGTETRAYPLPHPACSHCNLSPQGDGNPPRIGFWLRLIELQFIPARGQKSTSATGVCQQRRCFAFSYILFYKLGTAPAGIVFVTGSALTPSGTSGFMGRISCR